MKITILTDNTVVSRNMRGEHGLSFLINTGENCLLFDTGQGLVLDDNARTMGLELDAVDTVVFSHGHYDHTGGLASVLRATTRPLAVYAHPEAFLPKYAKEKSETRAIGMPGECVVAVRDSGCCLISSRQSEQVVTGVRTTGEILRQHPEEAITEPFFRDLEGREADLLQDDQALFMDTAQGLVVLLGCAHAGLINTLDHVQELTPGRSIRAVIGGMHLNSATDSRIQWTTGELNRFKINMLVPLHCTGQKAVAAFWAAFPGACRQGGAGSIFEF